MLMFKKKVEVRCRKTSRKEREKVLLEEKPVSLAVDDILSGRYVIQESEDIKNY